MNLIALLVLVVLACLAYSKAKKKNQKNKEDKLIASYNPNKRISYPRAKHPDGTKKTEQERKKDMELYFEKASENGKMFARVEKIKQTRIGVTHYIWRSADDGGDCPECKKNNGKKFSWEKPPKTGHPGEGKCCPNGLCRCYPEAKVK